MCEYIYLWWVSSYSSSSSCLYSMLDGVVLLLLNSILTYNRVCMPEIRLYAHQGKTAWHFRNISRQAATPPIP